MRLVHTSAISLQTRLQHQSRAIPAPSPQASRACHTPTFTATKKGDPEPGLVGVPSSHSSRRNTSSSSRTLSKKPIASSSSSMAARAAEGKQEAGSTQRQQQQQQQQRPPHAPAGKQAGDRRAGKSAGQAYTSMLASAESVLAPGHRLAMKGSIMNLFLLPLSSSPARRARLPRVPTLRKGKRGLWAAAGGINAGQGRQPAPSAVRSFRSHSALPRPGAGLVRASRCCAAGPTEPALSGPGGPIAPNAQETHVLTCEVELLVPSVVTGGRAAGGGFWSEGGREEAADRPGGRGGRSASQRQALFTTSRRSPGPGAGAGGGRRAASPRSHLSPTQSTSPWDHHKTEPPSHLGLRLHPAPLGCRGPLPVRNRSCHCTTVE